MRPLQAIALASALACAGGCAGNRAAERTGLGDKADDLPNRSAVSLISEWNASLPAATRASKYAKLAKSPFRFFRGTNHLFWHDLAKDDRLDEFGNKDTYTWIQGDMHTDNFGAYDNDRGDVVYSINDFDETVLADYQYDVWRMATSIVLVARANDLDDSADDLVEAFAESYLDTMASYRGNNDEDEVLFTAENVGQLLADFLAEVEVKRNREKALDRWTTTDGTDRHFDLENEDLAALSEPEREALLAAFAEYGDTLSGRRSFDADYFTVKDVARRLNAGTGSFGTPRFYVLIEGDTVAANDDHILDVKRQSAPTALTYLGNKARDDYDETFTDHAQRHALGQKALIKGTDDHLGWLSLADGDYSVRERSVYKDSVDTDDLVDVDSFEEIAESWGIILATTHARADKDFRPSLVPHSLDKEIDLLTDGEHSEFRELVVEVATQYADRVEQDYAAFTAACADGTLSCGDDQ
jgi:uncharacterized protein (DUF2252 family)